MKKLIFFLILCITLPLFSQTSSWGRILRNSFDQPITGLLNVELRHVSGSPIYTLTEQDPITKPGYYSNDAVEYGLYVLYVAGDDQSKPFWIGSDKLTAMANHANSLGQIGTSGYQDQSITADKLAPGAINVSAFQDESILSRHLRNSNVRRVDVDKLNVFSPLFFSYFIGGTDSIPYPKVDLGDFQYGANGLAIKSNGIKDKQLNVLKIFNPLWYSYNTTGDTIPYPKINNEHFQYGNGLTIKPDAIRDEIDFHKSFYNLFFDYGTFFGSDTTVFIRTDEPTMAVGAGGLKVANNSIKDEQVNFLKLFHGDYYNFSQAGGDTMVKANLYDPQLEWYFDIRDGLNKIKISDDGVSTTQIRDGEIYLVDLNSEVTDLIGSGGGSGGIPDDNSVSTQKIVDEAVTTPKVADEAITGVKIAAGTLVPQNFGTGSVNSNAILDATINGIDIAPLSIDVSKVAISGQYHVMYGTGSGSNATTGLLPGTSLQPASVSLAQMGVGSVGTNQILDGDVTLIDLATNSVNSSKVVDGSLTGSDLANLTVSAANMNIGSVHSVHVIDGSLALVDLDQSLQDLLSTQTADPRIADVTAFGADHTGSASSNTAFQNALNADAKYVYVPAGVYIGLSGLSVSASSKTIIAHENAVMIANSASNYFYTNSSSGLDTLKVIGGRYSDGRLANITASGNEAYIEFRDINLDNIGTTTISCPANVVFDGCKGDGLDATISNLSNTVGSLVIKNSNINNFYLGQNVAELQLINNHFKNFSLSTTGGTGYTKTIELFNNNIEFSYMNLRFSELANFSNNPYLKTSGIVGDYNSSNASSPTIYISNSYLFNTANINIQGIKNVKLSNNTIVGESAANLLNLDSDVENIDIVANEIYNSSGKAIRIPLIFYSSTNNNTKLFNIVGNNIKGNVEIYDASSTSTTLSNSKLIFKDNTLSSAAKFSVSDKAFIKNNKFLGTIDLYSSTIFEDNTLEGDVVLRPTLMNIHFDDTLVKNNSFLYAGVALNLFSDNLTLLNNDFIDVSVFGITISSGSDNTYINTSLAKDVTGTFISDSGTNTTVLNTITR